MTQLQICGTIRIQLFLVLLFLATVNQIDPARTVANDRALIRVSVNETPVIGHPLAWDSKVLVLLHRDGSISNHNINDIKKFAELESEFTPYSSTKIQQRLQAEFGDDYRVSRTEHFLVVHPREGAQKWPATFENMYRQFKHYATVRGCSIQSPEFPMIAIILKSRQEFQRYSIKHKTMIHPLVVGYYSLESNRIITYAQNEVTEKNEIIEDPTVIHEAAHQSAFNTGIHNRFSPPPKWATEGLAVMFEAPGVHFSSRHSKREDRINEARLAELKYYMASDHHKGKIVELIESDKLFMTDPRLAYALSWGLTFYLAETQPRSYFSYLKDTSQHKPFAKYTPLERKTDFTRRFGGNIELLESRMEQFIDDLNPQ